MPPELDYSFLDDDGVLSVIRITERVLRWRKAKPEETLLAQRNLEAVLKEAEKRHITPKRYRGSRKPKFQPQLYCEYVGINAARYRDRNFSADRANIRDVNDYLKAGRQIFGLTHQGDPEVVRLSMVRTRQGHLQGRVFGTLNDWISIRGLRFDGERLNELPRPYDRR